MIPPRLAAAIALGTASGAWAARPVPIGFVAVVLTAALAWRRPWLWCLAALVVASLLSARSWDGLDPPHGGEVSGVALMITDPEDRYGAVRAELRLGGRRYDAWARGPAAGRLRTALAGEVLHITGTSSPLRGRSAPHLRRRHIVARLAVEAAGPAGPGSPLSRIANATRRTIDRGSAVLGDPARGLFGGFVLGDDRGQDPATVERFRSAGLTHLLVVSGQNVAFVLALAAPLVSRGANGARLAWTAAVLVLFGTIVRWDPSVTRAVVMAALAISTRTLGRPIDRLRVLALAVTLILMLDPLLVGSVSFLLSVAASAGIAVLSPWFASLMRGPRPLVEILSTTAGAQVGVAPVLLPVFGSLPLVSIPANLLAVPVAGPLMMWGMVAGVPAGLAGGPVAAALHWPTRVMLGWVEGVARWAAELGAPPVGLTAGLTTVLAMACLAAHPATRRLVLPGGASILVIAAWLTAPRPDFGSMALSEGARLWSAGGGSVLVVSEIDGRLPGHLRDANVGRVDVVVMTRGGARAAELLVELRALVRPRQVLVPHASGIPAAVAVSSPSSARVGPISIWLTPRGDRLKVQVSVGSEHEADSG